MRFERVALINERRIERVEAKQSLARMLHGHDPLHISRYSDRARLRQ